MRKITTALIGIFLLALAACGSGSGGGYGNETTPNKSEESTTPKSTEGSGDAASGAAAVKVASTSLGDVLVDDKGMTLYMYEPDKQGESTCYESCAKAWPALLVTGTPTVGTGADDSLVATVARTDAKLQVTYDKWPLYYYAKDVAPGDTLGQDVGGIWYVLGADGKPIEDE